MLEVKTKDGDVVMKREIAAPLARFFGFSGRPWDPRGFHGARTPWRLDVLMISGVEHT